MTNVLNTAHQNHTKLCVNFSRFLEPRSLDDFLEYKMSMGLYNGEKLVVQLSGCHDLHATDGNSCSKEQCYLMCCFGFRQFESRSLHIMKAPLSKHAFFEIANTTKSTKAGFKMLRSVHR